MTTEDMIIEKYNEINDTIVQLKNRLIDKLSDCGIDKEGESFTNIIHGIGEINAVEKYYSNNLKPTKEPNLPIITKDNDEYTSDSTLTYYNYCLIQKLIYYINLLKYYLALKGVDLDKVNQANTIAKLIELIDDIDFIYDTILTVNINEYGEYYATEEIQIPFSLTNAYNGDNVNVGEIEVWDGDVFITKRLVSNGLYIKLKPGEHTLTIKYIGTEKYHESSSVNVTINVKKSRAVINTLIENQTESSFYYKSIDTGYNDDEWSITIQVTDEKNNPLSDIPLTIKDNKIDNEGNNTSTTVLVDDAITDENGEYVIQNININEYGEHDIQVETNIITNDIGNSSDYISILIAYHVFNLSSNPKIIYISSAEYNDSIFVDVLDKYGNTIQDINATIQVINVITEENIQNVSFGKNDNDMWVITFNRLYPGKFGYYQVTLSAEIEDTIRRADTDDDGILYRSNISETYIIDIRERSDIITSIDINTYGNLVLSKERDISYVDNNFSIQVFDIVSALSLDNNGNIVIDYLPKPNLVGDLSTDLNTISTYDTEDAISSVEINEDGNIEYKIIRDIYSLDNRREEYNKQRE